VIATLLMEAPPRVVENPSAGPSNLRPQVPSRQADDEAIARQLQDTLNAEQPTFRELNQAESSMDKGEDGEPSRKGKGKEDDEMDVDEDHSKGAKGKGKQKEVESSADNEGRGAAVRPTSKVFLGRRMAIGTGQYFPTDCTTCQKKGTRCEKDANGGACVTCKKVKARCSHMPARTEMSRRKVKSKAFISDSEYEEPAGRQQVAEPPVKKRRSAAKRAAKLIEEVERNLGEAKDVSRAAVKKKTEGRRRGVRRKVNEVIDVVRGAFHLLCKIYSKF
jgi:hypothetical protein